MYQALGDIQIRRPSLPSQILWPHREMSQMQEEVQWKVGSKCCSGVVERVWTGNEETGVRPLGREDPLEGGMATHSSILAWKIPMDRRAWWATIHGVAKSWK